MRKNIFILATIIVGVLGLIISYSQANEDSGYIHLVETFNNTGANFKSYNIKANVKVNEDLEITKMREICIDIVNNLGLEENDIKWGENSNKNEKQIYAQTQVDKKSISIIIDNKKSKESYIIVDITGNKVYKDIVGIYEILQDTLKMYSNKVDIYTCLIGEYDNKLQNYKYNDIYKNILYNMNAEEIEKIHDENFLSITAYSKKINSTYLEYLGNKVNLNIGMRYSEHEEKTLIYIATPLIRLDY